LLFELVFALFACVDRLAAFSRDFDLRRRSHGTVEHYEIKVLESEFGEGFFDVFDDVRGVVDFVWEEHFLSGESLLPLIGYFLSVFVFKLFFGIKDEFKGITEGLFVVFDIEMCVSEVGGLHEEVIEVKGFIVGFEVERAESNEWHLVAVVEEDFRVGVHLVVIVKNGDLVF
jgi:hypothetical protein